MYKAIFGVILMFLTCLCHADSIIDKAKLRYNMGKCLISNTETMCAFEEMLKSEPTETIKQDSEVISKTNRYFVSVPNNNWKILWPGEKRAIDLELIHNSGHALVMVNWKEGEIDTYRKHARAPLQSILENSGSEPEEIPFDIWPYNDGGVFYATCYATNKKTEECIFSAAANMPNGVVSFTAITEHNDTLAEDIMQIFASVDIPQ